MGEKPVVLAVDDEEKILDLLSSYLDSNGYRGICAKTGKEGAALFEKYDPALVLLDLMLPDFSGEDLCRRIREVSDVPIIMLTARIDEESIIRCLKLGADDYVCKPFSPRQLMARVEAALRRSLKDGVRGQDLVYGDLALNTEDRRVWLKGKDLALTSREYGILRALMSRPSKIFTREEILDRLEGDDFEGFDRSVDTHIKRLRQKLGDDSRSPRYIMTVYGMGYRFAGEGESSQ
ncbi:MAG: response regulator transcription factor [Treponema sp.]|jgi:DNA-binding response OmpR family regulator|nr:response regulator transcription factor [Treponema sp.]